MTERTDKIQSKDGQRCTFSNLKENALKIEGRKNEIRLKKRSKPFFFVAEKIRK